MALQFQVSQRIALHPPPQFHPLAAKQAKRGGHIATQGLSQAVLSRVLRYRGYRSYGIAKKTQKKTDKSREKTEKMRKVSGLTSA